MSISAQADALVIGGGPSGASCALWLKLLGLEPLLIDKADRLGGLQGSSPYPNDWILGQRYPSGTDFAQALATHLSELHVSVRLETTIISLGREEKPSGYLAGLGGGDSLRTSFIVMATGVAPRRPDFPVTPEVIVGPGKRVFETDFRDRRVAILGGGDNAFENYLFVSRQKPSRIRIFARAIRARYEFVSRVPREDVHLGSYEVDVRGRRADDFEYDDLLVFYGWECRNPLKPFISLETENGYIRTNRHRITSIDSVYAIGEMACAAHPSVVTSMADGVIAAKSIQERMDASRVERWFD